MVWCLCNHVQTESHATCLVLPPFHNKNTVSKNKKGRHLKVTRRKENSKSKLNNKLSDVFWPKWDDMCSHICSADNKKNLTKSCCSFLLSAPVKKKDKKKPFLNATQISYMGPRDPLVPPGLPCQLIKQGFKCSLMWVFFFHFLIYDQTMTFWSFTSCCHVYILVK